ncbi:TerC/Alx family metal homeostasis membrane protein [Nocardioides sp.]|uniref:TerC/Alx family metal homeostasis membrane protein n=1 Tax=Nocardioides sp. TaxID=35761 RepID=UPI002F415DB7
MHTSVPMPLWIAAAIILVMLVAADLVAVSRRSERPTLRTCLLWVGANVTAAAAFGVALLVVDRRAGTEFFAGYLTEYSLSVDNLFVFLVIMNTFGVLAAARDRTLLIGIVLSFVMRAVLIVGGTVLVSAASWTFYLFGLLLVYTAVGLLREQEPDEEFQEYAVLRWLRRYLPLSPSYDGDRLRTRVDGRSMWTPLVVVVAAIAVANVVFALDSIPAILGLTQDAFVILTANAFALLGLRQLFFVVEALLTRLVYLQPALALVLGFIGVKLILEGLRGSHVDHLGALTVPEVGILPSLGFIVVVLGVAAIASLTIGAREPSEPS